MFIAILKKDYDTYGFIYYSYDAYQADTFSPEVDTVCLIPLKVSGKSYKERKEDLRDKAIEWSNNAGLYCDCSWGELAIIEEFFRKNAKRYGLLEEFKAEGIC